MFRHILLPTDGSTLSEKAARAGIDFAKSIGAKVTSVHVIPKYQPKASYYPFNIEWSPYDDVTASFIEMTPEQYEEYSKAVADNVLSGIRDAAHRAGVRCECIYLNSDHPNEAIISAANNRRCDLIVMASRGPMGVGALVGSETTRVLSHAAIPVLLFC
jgi:nucleotide-binding universal stress UspA family protein